MNKDKTYLYIVIALIIAGIISIISGVCKDMIIKEQEYTIKLQLQIYEIQKERIQMKDRVIEKQDSIIYQLFDRLEINQLKQ